MKQLVIAAFLTTALAATSDYEAMFKAFKATRLKAYADEAEESKRFKAFVENMKKAKVLQAANPHATFGPNAFADLSEAEFKSYHNGDAHFKVAMQKPRKEVVSTALERKSATGQKIDWRTKGAVTGVKNQGQCGSCWAFSTTGNIEGQWFLSGHTLTPLSEQELASCDTIDSGCNGGLMDNAFTWLLEDRHGSIVTEASFPYASDLGVAPPCPADLNSLPIGATITGYNDLQKTEDAMAAYCFAHGPVAIALDATSFQTYAGGILTNCISQQIDHGVLIVGFDDTNVPPYWIIKNSWGVNWGEEGYIRVAKGSNQCLITSYPTSSIVAKTSKDADSAENGQAYTYYSQSLYVTRPGRGPCDVTDPNPLTEPLACQIVYHGFQDLSTSATCTATNLTIWQYNSSDCSGIGQAVSYATNVCMPYGDSPSDHEMYTCF